MSTPELPHISDEVLSRIIGRSVLDAVIIAGPDSRICYWNASAERLFGRPAADVLGRDMHDLITPDRYREKAKAGFRHFSETGEGPLLGRVVRIEAVRSDGTEFPIELSVSPIELGGRRGAMAILRDDTERRALEQDLQKLASVDVLTGVLNRRAFFSRAEEEAKRARRHTRVASLLMCDLDHFKAVNDRHGHTVGDQVLMAFASRLAGCLRESDIFGRVGGEEFAVLLPETDAEGAAILAERIRSETEAVAIPIEGGELRITVSIGIAVWNAVEESVDQALQRSDRALYKAKEGGRNRVVLEPGPAPGTSAARRP